MGTLTAVYDACVLYSAPLRDILMWLSVTDLFRARWTEQILDEWSRKLHRGSLRNPPKSVDIYLDTLEGQQLTKTVQALRKFEGLI